MKSKFVQYYVEGDDEKRFVDILKTDLGVIKPGNVQKFNVIECALTNARLMALRPGTMVVLVFDTDTGHVDTLNNNIEKLKACPAVSEIVTIPQVKNLEDELVRSCNIKTAQELLGSKSKSDFKTDFIRVTNLAHKLREHKFDINLLWCKNPRSPYRSIENMSKKVKLVTR